MARLFSLSLAGLVLSALMVTVAHAIPALPPDFDECGSVTWEGECVGNEVRWCEDGQLFEADCAALGGTCGWDPENGVYDCVDLDEGCGGETFEGRCDGNSVIWCEDGEVFEADCGTLESLPGGLCGFNCEFQAYDCAAPSDHISSPAGCDSGGGGLSVDPGDSDASGSVAEQASTPSSGSGGCSGSQTGSSALWLLLAGLGLATTLRRGRLA